MKIDDGRRADGSASPNRPTQGTTRPRDARKGHRPIERHRHLRRQGHRLPVLEVRPARPATSTIAVRHADGRRRRCGRRPDDRAATPTIRHSAAPPRPTTSSTCGSRTCRSCSSRRCRDPGLRRASRARDAFLVRDGGALARHGAGARIPRRPMRRKTSEPFVEVSGRKGQGVKADDLIDTRHRAGADRSGQAQSRAALPPNTGRIAEQIARRRGPLFPGEVFAHQDDRLRHRRST